MVEMSPARVVLVFSELEAFSRLLMSLASDCWALLTARCRAAVELACACCWRAVLLSNVTRPLSWLTTLFQSLTAAWPHVTGWMLPSVWGTFSVTEEPFTFPYQV